MRTGDVVLLKDDMNNKPRVSILKFLASGYSCNVNKFVGICFVEIPANARIQG